MNKPQGFVGNPIALAIALSGGFALPALAQEMTLEEITVTAQKREQNVQEVPVTVDTFSSEDMKNTQALKLSDMADYVPGFEAGSGVTQSTLTIRGISSSNISSGGDPSVAVFYDDAYVPSAATSMAFSDMQRVEVLKGPQGTLFGRNAAAGSVNMVPNRPEAEFDAFVSARLGNFGLQQLEGMLNAPLTDNFYVRGNLLSFQRDGYIRNIHPGGADSGAQDVLAGRISAWWDMSDDTALQLSYDWDEVDNAPRQAIGVSEHSYSTNPFDRRVENDVVDGEETRSMSTINAKLMHSFSDTLSLKWVSSYRQYETSNREEEDGTADISRYLDTNNIFDSDISYHELQVNFTGERFSAVMGANYSRENIFQITDVTASASSVSRLVTADLVNNPALREMIAGGAALSVGGFPGDGGIGDMAAGQALAALDSVDHLWNAQDWATFTTLLGAGPLPQDSIYYDGVAAQLGTAMLFGPSFAGHYWTEREQNEGDFSNSGVYFDMDYTLTEKISVLAGLRHSRDRKSFSWLTPGPSFAEQRPGVEPVVFGGADGFNVGEGLLEASGKWSATTGRLVGQYRFNESAMTFLSYSTGYKSGGFDSLNLHTAVEPLAPEKVKNIELGLKGDLLNDLMRVQLSYFDTRVDDRQRAVESKPPEAANALPRVISGDQKINGLEATVDWLPLDTLRLGLVTTVRDESSRWQPFHDAEGELRDERSKSSVNTAYTLAVDWAPVIPVGSLNVHMDYIFRENTDELEPDFIDSYSDIKGVGRDHKRLNGRIAWSSEQGNYELALWGRNLLDNRVVGSVGGRTLDIFGTPYTSISEPRSYGAELRYNF